MTRKNQIKRFIYTIIFRIILVILIVIMAQRSFRILDKTDRLHGSDVTTILMTAFKGKVKPFCECFGWLCEHYTIFCILLLVVGIVGCVCSYIGFFQDINGYNHSNKGYLFALLMVLVFMVLSFAAAEYCVLDLQPETFIYPDTIYTTGRITSVSQPQKAPQLNPFAESKNLYTCTYEYYDYNESDEQITITSQTKTHVLYKIGDEVGVNIDKNNINNSYVYEDIYDDNKIQAGVLFFIFIVTLNILAPVKREHNDDDNNGGVADDD